MLKKSFYWAKIIVFGSVGSQRSVMPHDRFPYLHVILTEENPKHSTGRDAAATGPEIYWRLVCVLLGNNTGVGVSYDLRNVEYNWEESSVPQRSASVHHYLAF